MSKPYQDSSCSPVAEPLPGKGAVMSGAGGGRGRAAALMFARSDATVIAGDRKLRIRPLVDFVRREAADGNVLRSVTPDGGEMVQLSLKDLRPNGLVGIPRNSIVRESL